MHSARRALRLPALSDQTVTPFEEIKLRALQTRLYLITHRMSTHRGYFFLTPDELTLIARTYNADPPAYFQGLRLFVIEGRDV
jgi:hypothetical protein